MDNPYRSCKLVTRVRPRQSYPFMDPEDPGEVVFWVEHADHTYKTEEQLMFRDKW